MTYYTHIILNKYCFKKSDYIPYTSILHRLAESVLGDNNIVSEENKLRNYLVLEFRIKAR